MKVIHKTNHNINIVGIDNHELAGLDVTTVTLFHTPKGKIVGIFNKYVYLGKGSSTNSPGQMEHFKVNMCDKSIKVGGEQHIETLEGRTLPLSIKNGLAYLKFLGAPTVSDLEKYPHVMFTSPGEWDPSILDHEFTEDEITSMSVGESLQLTEPSIHNLLKSQESSINESSTNLISSWMHRLIQIQGSIKLSPQFTFMNLRSAPLILKPCTHSLVRLLLTLSKTPSR